ncbi:hypothetical protein OC861_000554 [Tilletia horrida]|nr:hypothetical protein OC845_003605 [Tilletia horrida]KAK0569843.1 hypothetical protein OC861_000554 [Tilletia horrida]
MARTLASIRPYQIAAVTGLSAVVLLASSYAALSGATSYNLFYSDPFRFPDAVTASKPATVFANRKNLLNALFVKKVWLWTTLAFASQAYLLRRPWSKLLMRVNGNKEPGPYDPLVRSILRYFVATTAWVFFTSWFLGPSLTDRTFLLTGGQCRLEIGDHNIPVPSELCRSRTKVSYESHPHLFHTSGFDLYGKDTKSLTDLAPRFRGGLDMSGHTFLLILSILFLLEEIAPFLPYLLLRLPAPIRPTKALIEGIIPRSQWASLDPFSRPGSSPTQSSNANNAPSTPPASQTLAQQLSNPHIQAQIAAGAIFAHIGLSFWMLLMTQLYFHTLSEKVAGLVVGILSWLALPKDLPASRGAPAKTQ